MNFFSVKNYGELRQFRSVRKVYGEDRHLHEHEFMVMAPNGPTAATLINSLVAEDYKKYGPKLFAAKINKKNGSLNVEEEDAA